MATKTCVFEIPSTDGGDLRGAMFGPTTGKVNRGDDLQVVVNWLAATPPPNVLLGRFMFSMAPTAASTQVFATPFLNGANKQLCFSQPQPAQNIGGSFTFPGFPVLANRPNNVLGKYELTFVVEDPASQTQWSEDPEFDVES